MVVRDFSIPDNGPVPDCRGEHWEVLADKSYQMATECSLVVHLKKQPTHPYPLRNRT